MVVMSALRWQIILPIAVILRFLELVRLLRMKSEDKGEIPFLQNQFTLSA
ncbi:hypothetical protein ACFWMP_06575 [Paenibacillus sp. NPDC058367]